MWILRTACLQLVEWARDPQTAHWTLAVNVSARQFRHSHFVDEVLGVLEETGANPHRLKLELTETLLLDDVEDTIQRMDTLRASGLGFSLDDFGTGYSSLSYLKRLPLDQLKIDQTFVRDLLTDANDASISRTIVTLAHSLDLGGDCRGRRNPGATRHAGQSGVPHLAGLPVRAPRACRCAGAVGGQRDDLVTPCLSAGYPPLDVTHGLPMGCPQLSPLADIG